MLLKDTSVDCVTWHSNPSPFAPFLNYLAATQKNKTNPNNQTNVQGRSPRARSDRPSACTFPLRDIIQTCQHAWLTRVGGWGQGVLGVPGPRLATFVLEPLDPFWAIQPTGQSCPVSPQPPINHTRPDGF